MRVHGRYTIKRRTNLEQRTYDKYRPELSEDFYHICGYCGKSEAVTKKGFEIDHFVPQTLAKNLTNSYENLVYCCFTCNRKKSSKWPTKNASLANDGIKGFCDPASDEFDIHLQRDDSGKIISCSSVGDYMLKKAFCFDKRPTDVVWKAMQIIEIKNELRAKWNSLASEDKDMYMRIDEELDSLLGYIFKENE